MNIFLAVQNERQPRNSAQVRHEQIEQEIERTHAPAASTVSATHPAFMPVPVGQPHPLKMTPRMHEFLTSSSNDDGENIVNLYLLRIN